MFERRGSFGSRMIVGGLVDRKVVSDGLVRVPFHFPDRVNVHQCGSQTLDRVEEGMLCAASSGTVQRLRSHSSFSAGPRVRYVQFTGYDAMSSWI